MAAYGSVEYQSQSKIMPRRSLHILLVVTLMMPVEVFANFKSGIACGNRNIDAREFYAAYDCYFDAYRSSTTKREKVTALGSLAFTSVKMRNKQQAANHLIELLNVEPDNSWARSFARDQDINIGKIADTISPIFYVAVVIPLFYYRNQVLAFASSVISLLLQIFQVIYKIIVGIISLTSGTKRVAQTFMGKSHRHSIFISYSHADKVILKNLKKHLKYYEDNGHISSWDDTKISTGMLWKKEIDNALSSANVAILLVSSDFLASDFIMKYELPTLLKSAKLNGTKILPVIVTPCAYEDSHLVNFQAFNSPSNPVIGLTRVKKEDLYAKIAKEVKDVVAENSE